MRFFKIYIVFPFFALIAFLGCSKDNQDGPTGPSLEPSAETYMPLKVGSAYTYKQTGSVQGEIFIETTTLTIVGTRTFQENNNTYYVIVNSFQDSMYLRIEKNIVYEYVPLELQEIPNFDFNKEEGQIWEIYSESNPMGSMTVTGKFLGTEDITVPSGTFENCAKFENTWRVILFDNSGEVLTSVEGKDLQWLAPNVGIVKRTRMHESLVTAIEELVAYAVP